MQIGEFEITSDMYEKWLKHLTIWFNNSGRAEETLERHLDNVQRLYNEGGILYRLMFLEKSETIDKNNLGQHWVADENVLEDIRSMLLDTARGEKDPDYEYTITIKIPPKNVNIQDSISEFLANPNEEEIWLDNTKNAKIQDIQKAPIAEMIVRRRFAKLTESSTFIASIPEVNMKEYAKAAIRDIFIQMPTRSVNLNNWHGYKQYVEGYFGNNSYKVAMKELKEDGWLTKGETRYEWKKAYGPVGTFPKKDHLNEWADFIKYHDNTGKEKHLDIDDKKAFPFGYKKDKDKLIIGRPDKTHYGAGINTEVDDYTGRIWPTENVISFWKYPETKSKLLRIIKDLNSMLPTKRWYKAGKITTRWKIDVPNVAKNVKTLDMNNIYNYGLFSSLVPIKNWEPDMISNHRDFKRELKKQQQKHLQSPMNKKDINVPVGIGSRKTPVGLSPTQRHQMKSTSEIKEWADEISIKGQHTVLDYTDLDAYPFIFHIKENKVYIGEEGQTHGTVETGVYWKNNGGIAGRIWTVEKIISFWEYPDNVAMYKNLIAQLNKSIVEKNSSEGLDIPEVTSSWKLDMPDTSVDLLSGHDFWERVRKMDGGESGFRQTPSILIPVFDWDPKLVKNPKNYMKQMKKKQGAHMLSPIAKKVTGMKDVGSRKTPSGLSATQRHQMKSTSEELMNEHPDNIEDTALRFGNRGAFTFGYINQRLWVGDNTHRSLHVDGDTGIPRKEFEHGGRIWVAEKIMSFWAYPDDSYKMKHICNDLSKWFKSGWEKDKENIENSSSSQFVGRTYDIWNTFNVEIIVSEEGTIDVDVEYNKHNEITTENKVNKIIPVKDYVSSEERSSEELAIQHVLSPMKKSDKELPIGIGSTKTLAGLTPTKYHQLRSTSESADVFTHPDSGNRIYFNFGGVAFGYVDGKMEISKYNGTHGDIVNTIFNKFKVTYMGLARDKFKYPGRVWPSEKIISFWFYPKNKNELNKILRDLEEKLDIIINSEYRLEVRKNHLYKFIYIDEYVGSEEVALSDLKKGHMLSPAYKNYEKVPPGWGSRKTPVGLSTTQRHQMKSTSEDIDEWADSAIVGDKELDWSDRDAFAFGFDDDSHKFQISPPTETHGYIGANEYNDNYIRGRYWIKSKVLAFWVYPKDQHDMQRLIKLINDTKGKKTIDNTWKVEIPFYDGDISNPLGNRQGGIKRGNSIIIPIEEFDSEVIENPVEWKQHAQKQLQLHMLSPMAKKSEFMPGVGSNKTPAGLSATQRHQIKSTSEGIKLVESPDYVHLNTGEEIEYQDDDAYGFYFLEGELYISDTAGQTHGDGVYRSGKYNSDEIRTIQMGNPIYGRIWVESEMLSFWNPPTSRKEMADLSDKLSDNFENDIDVWDDFEVEIYDYDNIIIPVKSYKSSEAAPDEEYQRHLLSPAKKKDIKVPVGIGSNKTPVGLSATQRHQMKSTSENKLNEIKTEYGCLMLKIEFPWWRNFTEKYINDEDIYNNAAQEFGREYKAHITVLYGFTENIDVEKMKKMLYTLKRPISVELTKIDTFNPKEFDVVKFAVKSKTLVNLNEIVSEKFDYVKTFDEYHPHVTIAYVKSGMGEKYIGNLKMPIFTSSSTFIYSYPGGKTDEFNYLQNK